MPFDSQESDSVLRALGPDIASLGHSHPIQSLKTPNRSPSHLITLKWSCLQPRTPDTL